MEFQFPPVLTWVSLVERRKAWSLFLHLSPRSLCYPVREVEGPLGIKNALSRDQSPFRSRPRALDPAPTTQLARDSGICKTGELFKGVGARRRSLPGAAQPASLPGPRPGPFRLCATVRAETLPICRTSCLTKSVSYRTCSQPHPLPTRWGPVGAAAAGPTWGTQKDPL